MWCPSPLTMVDKGPLLTSAIIFYLSIGAAIFQLLEEPNWRLAVSKFAVAREEILREHPCLTKDALEKIVQTVSEAAGQGVTLSGGSSFEIWNWPNAVIFSATVITTIGYGNIAPKTPSGRMFCVFYGLCGIPLCLTWISELGKFFGGRVKRLGQFLTKKGLSLRKAQLVCTVAFLLWGALVHLAIPPFVFMDQEGWSYIDGLYFSFVTLTTIGFGDLVTGVNPTADYPVLYRYFVELWICLGLAWLSLFFNWNVHMVVEAHKAFKKRRQRHRYPFGELAQHKTSSKPLAALPPTKNVDIFRFLSEKQDNYNDVIKQIGQKRHDNNSQVKRNGNRARSHSTDCVNGILALEHSPWRKRHYSFSDHISTVFSRTGGGETGLDIRRHKSDLGLHINSMECQGNTMVGSHLGEDNVSTPLMQLNDDNNFFDKEGCLNIDQPTLMACCKGEERNCTSNESVFIPESMSCSHSFDPLLGSSFKECRKQRGHIAT